MKKLLIATAALAMVAGTAQAQSSVTVYGAIGGSSNAYKTGGVEAATQFQNASRDHLGTTALGFMGTEDLGGGNSAFFKLEGDLSGTGVLGGSVTTSAPTVTTTTTTTSTSTAVGAGGGTPTITSTSTSTSIASAPTTTPHNIFNRHAHVGLKTNFGTLTIGRQNDSVKDTEALAQMNNLSDNLGNNTVVGDRISQAYKYATPVWNGLSATYTYSNNPVDTDLTALDSTTKHNSFAINYKLPVNGGVDLAYAYGKQETAGSAELKTSRYSARTTFGNVTVGAAYTANTQGANELNQTLVSAKYALGNIDLMAHYWNNQQTGSVFGPDDSSTKRGVSNGGDGYGVMAAYNFSKRTAVYAGYSDFSADTAAKDQKVTTVGIFHKF